ncbi:MAG: NAD(P)-binding domain-containing protein, partial [Alphaproteobacteria bacterium]|nr:NAD(P)-binding domain-containing protein [Alphaproteobacteria bacterium]
MARIAFIGLGNMGLPMARNLARAGHHVVGFDLNEAARNAFGECAASGAEAAAGADVVITMLPAGEHVRAAWQGLAQAAPDALKIDCSTIDVTTAQDLASRQPGMLDAPVSGGVMGAENSTLTFMVGGEADSFAEAK